MGFFRKKSTRQPPASEPLPSWDDTRWRSHLRANALGTEHHCGIYVQMINDDRKEAARLFQNDDSARARSFAESAIRNNRTVTALAALNPLSNALYQRSESLQGYTSLVQIPEPARSGIVTLVFAAARLHMSYLTDTVNFLKEQFGPVHIEQVQAAEGELYPLVNATVRDALSPAPATRADVDKELASAVKQYFGIELTPNGESAPTRSHTAPIAAAAETATSATPERARTSAIGVASAAAVATADSPVRGATQDVARAMPEAQSTLEVRRAQTTPLSAASSDLGAPVSPQLSPGRGRLPPASTPASAPTSTPPPAPTSEPAPVPAFEPTPAPVPAPETASVPRSAPVPEDSPPTRNTMYAAATAPARYTEQAANAYPLGASEHPSTAYPLSIPEVLSASVDSGGLMRGRAGALAEAGVDEVDGGTRETYAAAQKAMSLPPRPPTNGREERSRDGELSPGLGTRSITDFRTLPTHVRLFDDRDEALIARYEHLREVLAA